MKRIILMLSLLTALSASATNWYVRPGGAGARTGTSWTDAVDFSASQALSLAADDTVWIAGGTYTTSVNITKSGTSGHPILYKRVRSTDAVPVAASGWSAAFDAQALVHPTAAFPIWWSTANVGSYLYFDGRVDSGIKFLIDKEVADYAGAVSFWFTWGQTSVTFTNIDMAGPAPDSNPYGPLTKYNTALMFKTWNGSGYNSIDNILVTHCRLHGAADIVLNQGCSTLTIENSKIYDNVVFGTPHANIFEFSYYNNFVLRYCDISAWQIEGFRPYANSGATTMYGNVWHDPSTVSMGARVLEADGPSSGARTIGPFKIYNETYVNIWGANSSGSSEIYGINPAEATYAAGSQIRNCLYWNCSVSFGCPISDWDYSCIGFTGTPPAGSNQSGTAPGSHTINNCSQPFINFAGKDYHITATVSSTLPRDKGLALGSPYNFDGDGDVRGGDGLYDIGAYEFVSGGGAAPVITQNPTATSMAVGGTISETVVATGTAPLTYQWLTNGVPITGATSATYTKANAQVADTFTYSCGVTNAFGGVASAGALVTVTNGTSPIAATDVVNLSFNPQATNTTADLVINISNTGTGTLTGDATTSAPFSIVSGSHYALTAGQSQAVTVRHTPTTKGQDTGTVAFTGGGGASVTVSGVSAWVLPLTSLDYTNMTFFAPFTRVDSTTILQTTEVPSLTGSGSAYCFVSNTTAATWTFTGLMEVTNGANNSFWFNVGGDPTGDAQICDVTNILGAGIFSQVVSARGVNGNFGTNALYPVTFNAPAGLVLISTHGREANMRLQRLVGSAAVQPAIIGGPNSMTATVGQTAVFSVSAVGTAPLTYQWTKGGVNIAGATSSSYSLNPVIGDNGSVFAVTVANGLGSVSGSATLTVVPSSIYIGTMKVTSGTVQTLTGQ